MNLAAVAIAAAFVDGFCSGRAGGLSVFGLLRAIQLQERGLRAFGSEGAVTI